MLTQIEWWGGLIFVLGALTHRIVMGALETKDEGIDWYRVQMHAFYLLPAVVLAGYFYPLEHRALQYTYLAVLGVSLLIVVVRLVQEMAGDSDDSDDKEKKRGGRRSETGARRRRRSAGLVVVGGGSSGAVQPGAGGVRAGLREGVAAGQTVDLD